MVKNLYTRGLYLSTLIAAIAYTWLTFNTSSANPAFKLTPAQRLTIVVPVIFIWLLGSYGAARFKSYAASIKDSPDGVGFNRIANGLLVLIYGGIFSSLVTSTYSYLKPELTAIPNRTVISGYLQVLIALTAYLLILRGGASLVRAVDANKAFVKKATWVLAIMLIVAMGLLYLALNHLPATALTTRQRPYYLTTAIAVATVILPYLVSWTLGAVGFMAIQTYGRKVKGALYKQALSSLTLGLATVITFSISLQVLTNLGYAFENWSLQALLILIYVILAIYALGYLFIARGARKLSKIETISLKEAS